MNSSDVDQEKRDTILDAVSISMLAVYLVLFAAVVYTSYAYVYK